MTAFPPLPNTPTIEPLALLDQAQVNSLVERIAALTKGDDKEQAFPTEAFQYIADAGLLAITLPGQPLDNQAANTGRLLQILKQIGAANLSVGRIYEGHVNALHLINLYARPEQKQGWYNDVSEHNRLFGVWNTQAADGVKLHVLGNGRYVLEGSKTFCSGASWIQRPLVTGELLGTSKTGWQMCIIPTERVKAIPQDDQFWQPLGMKASVSYKLDFTGVELNEEDLLGEPGDYYRQPYFSGGAIRFAAVQLGGAEALFNATRDYLNSLNRTDDLFQRARIGEMAYLIESGNNWINEAGAKADEWLARKEEAAKIIAYANMTRVAIEEICLRVMPLAERSVGARGLMSPLPFERIHRDLTFYLRQPAPDATIADLGGYVLTNPTNAHDLWH